MKITRLTVYLWLFAVTGCFAGFGSRNSAQVGVGYDSDPITTLWKYECNDGVKIASTRETPRACEDNAGIAQIRTTP